VIVVAVLVAPAAANAHPLAFSGFDVWAGERDVRVDFKLDVPSVLSVLDRAHPGAKPASLGTIRDQRSTVFDYLAANFHIGNDGQPCTPELPADLLVHAGTNKVLTTARFRCAGALDLLTSESTMFNEQSPAPEVVCNFHYQRALEHYFFNKGVPVAQIPVRKLLQVLPAVIDTTRPFEMARPPPGTDLGGGPARAAPAAHGGGFVAFLGQGILHILGGFDHVLFVVLLVIAARTPRQLVLIVSSFTIAHSITLVLGTFDLVRASPRLVEPLIALTIIYVAIENIVRRAPPARPAVTFGFGLVHGLGFSAALRELGLPARALVGPLVGFNAGVELGQLTIVLPLLPLMVWLRRRDQSFRRVSLAINAVVGLVACVWFVRRLVGPS
jgi:HupE / UreJ protein